jgi:UDP-2-acetamido-3-amino-2,3-dideoxy-glucuronate N-acetyltransferase
MSYFAHETAVIDAGCQIGEGSKIWHFSHLMPGCTSEKRATLAKML